MTKTEIRDRWVQWVQDLEGKTIQKAIERFDAICLLFTDGTYTKVIAEDDGDDGCVLLYTPSMGDLGELGAVSEEEYAAYKQEQKEVVDTRERAHYEMLKKKFEKQGEQQ